MNKSIKLWWSKQAARIDALSLRERGFLFLSVIFLVLALADVVLLTPAQLAHKQMTQRFAAQNTELDRFREELKALGQPVDAGKAVRADLAATEARMQGIDQEIAAIAPMAQGGQALEKVLVQFLRRHAGLTLLGVLTLEQEAVGSTSAAAPATGLTRRGLELRVSGPYGELVQYVKTLENALPVLRWGTLQLKGEKQPPELVLQVYVLGVQP